jgi:hypothetical protein
MPLKATLDGRPIISVLTSDEEWREAQKASKGGAKRLRMMDGARAYATHSRRDLRYFAHKPNQEREASGGESEEHEGLKAAAARAVQSRAGWAADVEVLGEGWRADVLAVRGAVKIAIEVQLSAQAKRSTQTRNDRFEASEVTAFWLKGKSNHYNDFGDGLQAPVTGRARDERMTSVTSSVDDLLSKVERQIKLANALARWIRSIPEWTYKIEKQGTVPACFSLRRGRSKQQILLAELGPSLLPQTFKPRNGDQIGADQFSGAILQLRIAAPHLQGYYASSFKLNEVDLYASLDRSLRPIMEGRVVWQGRQHREEVPGASYTIQRCAPPVELGSCA